MGNRKRGKRGKEKEERKKRKGKRGKEKEERKKRKGKRIYFLLLNVKKT
ncbi:hypothetical protein [Methanosarcina barkeri]|nr:hypothetical protein [Methanosarcina barkeri]